MPAFAVVTAPFNCQLMIIQPRANLAHHRLTPLIKLNMLIATVICH